ncbi:hypothetical protein HPB47_025779 [Ixodes persulcatus]|uniref:Uncharacterized protein n=1 Tax=Ixodes persulcatus TaxID=34615 RepID=A0AC60Q2A5_IXOPE|nr:hypothetical protein HPB47_025779 [Ixodes persulcatus]
MASPRGRTWRRHHGVVNVLKHPVFPKGPLSYYTRVTTTNLDAGPSLQTPVSLASFKQAVIPPDALGTQAREARGSYASSGRLTSFMQIEQARPASTEKRIVWFPCGGDDRSR